MDVREKLEVIAHLGDHITYKEDIGICYDSALAKVIEDAYMELKNGVTVQDKTEISDEFLEQLKNTPVTILQEEPTIEVVQEWISVKDRLPEKDIRVLVWMQDNEEGYTQMDTDRWSCTMEQGYHWIRWGKCVTHWMPLPQPPKGE